MRVIHIATAFPRFDGDVITPWLGALLEEQTRQGLEPAVLAPAYRGCGDTAWRGIPVYRFRYAPRTAETLTHDRTVPDRLADSPSSAALLPGYLAGGVLRAAAIASEGWDIAHVHWPMPHALFGSALRAASMRPVGLVCSYYSVELSWVENRLRWLEPLLRWSATTADRVTAISSVTARRVARYAPGPVDVIPFAAAVGPGRLHPPRLRSREGEFRILFVGRLVERKGVEVLVRAVSHLRGSLDATLTVVGEGPSIDSIRAAARRAGVEQHVRLEGRVSDQRLAELYEESDVFALPAVYDRKGDTEGLGVVLLEALRFGLPVVASDAGGIVDIVRGGDTGWLVPPGDETALARALSEVAAMPDEALRRVARGREWVETRFSLPAIVERLTETYRQARTTVGRDLRKGPRHG